MTLGTMAALSTRDSSRDHLTDRELRQVLHFVLPEGIVPGNEARHLPLLGMLRGNCQHVSVTSDPWSAKHRSASS